MDKFKVVKTYSDSIEATMAKDFLQDNGIEAFLADEYSGEILSSVVRGIKLITREKDFAQAEELLQSIADNVDENQNFEAEYITGILEESGALLNGHFKLTSGLHSDRYIEKIKVIQSPRKVEALCTILAKRLSNLRPDIVVGLAMGGIALGYEVAKQLNTDFIFTQRKDGEMTIRSGFRVEPGMKAIIIEDIVTTGGSVFEVIELLQSKGVEILAIGLLVDRTGGKIDFGIQTEALLSINVTAYKPEDCPLCQQGIPITTPGSSDKKV
ncbi:MAG: orotate phosphoribosyltransferase [Candidatus Cloacimonadia bacterium]